MEKHYLSIPFEVKGLHEDDKVFTFEGFASTFGNTDLDDDIILRGAFTESLAIRSPKLLWQHNTDEPLGVFTSIEERESGLFVKAEMPLSDTFVSGRVRPQMKIGSINSMSIGFFIKESSFDEDTDIRTIIRVELFEISLVSIPANPAAVVTSFKKADMESFFDLSAREQEKLLKEGVKFSANSAKELVHVLKGKKQNWDDSAELEKMKKLVKSFDDDRDDLELKKFEKLIQDLKRENKDA